MKILHQKSYRFVGIRDGMYLFVSAKDFFDPEVLLLTHCKYEMNNGSVFFFDPICEDGLNNTYSSIYEYEGYDSEGKLFNLNIPLERICNIEDVSAVCVNRSQYGEHTPQRRLVKYANLIKTELQ